MSDDDALLCVSGLQVAFRTDEGLVEAVRGVDFSVRRGQVLGIVGESGSGKSTAAMAPLGLLPGNGRVTGGRARLGTVDLLGCSPRRLRQLRGKMAGVIFQDPMTSLNPYLRVTTQLAEPLRQHRDLRGAAIRRAAGDLLERVGIPDPGTALDKYPHEFSGGQRQRILIAMALAGDPDLLVADEPTTALDVTVQAQVLALLQDLLQDRGLGLILVTHDMGVVAGMCDTVCVMRHGRFVETASADDLFATPQHPYTRMLLAAVPRLHGPRAERLSIAEEYS